MEDTRGTHDNRHIRITKNVKNSLRDFLKNNPRCQSHYSRNKDTKNI